MFLFSNIEKEQIRNNAVHWKPNNRNDLSFNFFFSIFNLKYIHYFYSKDYQQNLIQNKKKTYIILLITLPRRNYDLVHCLLVLMIYCTCIDQFSFYKKLYTHYFIYCIHILSKEKNCYLYFLYWYHHWPAYHRSVQFYVHI